MAKNDNKKHQQTNKKLEMELRQQKVYELKLKGLTMQRICAVLNISMKTCERDLDSIQDQRVKWLRKQIDKFDAEKYWQEQIDELNLIKKELWPALAESKGDRSLISRVLFELQEKLDHRLRASGVITTKVDPKETAQETLRIVWDRPPRNRNKK